MALVGLPAIANTALVFWPIRICPWRAPVIVQLGVTGQLKRKGWVHPQWVVVIVKQRRRRCT